MGTRGSLLFLLEPLQCFFEAQCRSLLEPRGDMTIGVQGYSYTGVAQPFAYHFWVDPLLEHQRSMGMAGIVELVAFKASPVHDLSEGATTCTLEGWP